MTPRSDTLEPAGTAAPGSSDASGRGWTRHLRVVPVLAAALFLAFAALAVSPELRHQVALSFTRQDTGYLELFFVDEQTARSCPVSSVGLEKRVQTEVGITSHFGTTRSLAWTVTVHPTRGTVRAQRGRIEIGPGRTGRFTARTPVELAPGSTGYTVTVTLDGRAERLLLHC